MYRDHPQSPIPAAARADFAFCRFYDYDPAWRTIAVIENAEPDATEIAASTGGTFSFTRIGIARFALQGQEHELELAWNDGTAVASSSPSPTRRAGESTYGGGRYLIDTVKGADLGFDRDAGTAVLDFNFAFNPSCSYDARWACPLAPAANRLPIAVTAGEQHVTRAEDVAGAGRERCRAGAGRLPELAQDVRDVPVHGVLAEEQRAGDLAVREPRCDEPQHLRTPCR